MGYQESFLFCPDQEYLEDVIRGLGKEHFEERWINIAEVVTLENDLEFNTEYMVGDVIEYKFPKGTKFIWITGDRSYQRRLFGERGLFGDIDQEDEILLFFIECLSRKLFGENKEWLFKTEKFDW